MKTTEVLQWILSEYGVQRNLERTALKCKVTFPPHQKDTYYNIWIDTPKDHYEFEWILTNFKREDGIEYLAWFILMQILEDGLPSWVNYVETSQQPFKVIL